MSNNKQTILDKVVFIEEHSEYLLPDGSSFNDAQSFVAEYYDDVYDEYMAEVELALCGYVKVEY